MDLKTRKQIRLKKWDYSDSGWYFVTICTQNRKMIFGEIIKNEMILNKYGIIAEQCLIEILKHFNNVDLYEFQIMPNHVHVIIVIRNKKMFVGAIFKSPVKLRSDSGEINFAPTKNTSLSMIIKWFKSISSINTRKSLNTFKWQKSFYDHIIRNEFDLYRIRQYIRNNPKNWDSDRNNLPEI
jgi:putative transposase